MCIQMLVIYVTQIYLISIKRMKEVMHLLMVKQAFDNLSKEDFLKSKGS